MKHKPNLSPSVFTRKDSIHAPYPKTPHARFTLPDLKDSSQFDFKLKQQTETISYLQKVVEGTDKQLQNKESQLYNMKNDYKSYLNKGGKFSLDSADIDKIYKDLKSAVSEMDNTTEKIIKKQEVKMVSYFNAKLNAVNYGLNLEKEKKFHDIQELSHNEAQTANELEAIKASAEFIESQNVRLLEENKRLKLEVSQRDEQIELITHKLLKYKQNYHKYLEQYKKLSFNTTGSVQLSCNTSPMVSPNHSLGESTVLEHIKFKNYEKTINNLRMSLTREKKNVKLINMQYSKEIDSKHEIESILRDCISDIRKEISKQSKDWRNVQFRKMVIDKLSKQEELLNFLHSSLTGSMNLSPLLTGN